MGASSSSPSPNYGPIYYVSTNLTCKTFGQYDTYPFTLNLTAPVVASAGSKISYTNAVPTIDLPPVFPASFAENGGSYTIPVNITLDLKNASPTNITISKTVHLPTSQTHIRIPEGSGTLPPLGPVTAGDGNGPLVMSLGKVKFTVNPYGLVVDCLTANPELVLGEVALA